MAESALPAAPRVSRPPNWRRRDASEAIYITNRGRRMADACSRPGRAKWTECQQWTRTLKQHRNQHRNQHQKSTSFCSFCSFLVYWPATTQSRNRSSLSLTREQSWYIRNVEKMGSELRMVLTN